MATAQELTDCHFYLLGNCTKGAECPYRHSPGAKKNKIECENWGSPQGCSDRGCNFRHPARTPQHNKDKDRSVIPCYWETQPSGCLKGASCPFWHSKPPAPAKEPAIKSSDGSDAPAKRTAEAPVVQRVLKINRTSSEKVPDFGIKTLAELKRESSSSISASGEEVGTEDTAAPAKPAATPKPAVAPAASPKPAAKAKTAAKPEAAAAKPAADSSSSPAPKRKEPESSASSSTDSVASTPAKAAAKTPVKAAKPSPKPAPAMPASSAAATSDAKAPAKAPAAKAPAPTAPKPAAAPTPAPAADPEEDELARLERELEEAGVTLGAK